MSEHTHPTRFWLPDGIIYQGAYSDQKYNADDVVEHEGTVLICIKDTGAGKTPNSNHWKPFIPQDYIDKKWCPMHYLENSYVSYNGTIYTCLRTTTSDPTSADWIITNYTYEGRWTPRIYNPGTMVKFKNKYYECIQTSTTEMPIDYTHWKLVDSPRHVPDWKIQQYNTGDIVVHDEKMYVCTATTTDESLQSESWKQLQEGAKWCGKWQRRVYPESTVVVAEGIMYVAVQEATDQLLTDTEYWRQLDNIKWCGNWEYQNYQAGEYVIYDSRPFLCIKNTVRNHPTESRFWFQFCEGGVEFPSWFPSPRSIEINIPFDQELKYHSSSGGYYWKVSQLLGTKTIPFDDVPKEIQNSLVAKPTATEVYMLSEWHVGEFDNNGRTERFCGVIFDGYYEGQGKLIAMLNPKTSQPGYRRYIQWRYELPFVTQPEEMDWLVLINRSPHPKITEFFKIASQHIQISNRVRIDESAFADEMREVISQEGYQESESRRQTQASNKGEMFKPTTYADYRELRLTEWVQSKYEIKMAHMQLGYSLHKRAEEQVNLWQEQWIKRMKTHTHEISSRINEMIRAFVGYDKWFTMSAMECKKVYPQITWNVHNKRVRLADIEAKRVELEQQWEEYEVATHVWKMLRLSEIERIIDVIKSMFPEEQKTKKNNRRKKTSKVKNV